MHFGLILSDPAHDTASRALLRDLCDRQLIPFSGFTDEPAPRFVGFTGDMDAFLRLCAQTLMRPGDAIPADAALRFLSGRDARCGNVIRRYVCLQLGLMPYIAAHPAVTELDGGHLLGDSLFIAHLGEDGRVDAELPSGTWTDLFSGEQFSAARLRLMRSVNAMPVLAAPNSIIPIGVNDRTPDYDYADRVTLHWFEPAARASVTLPDGTSFTLTETDGAVSCKTDTHAVYHIIVHRSGEESFIH